MKLKYILTLPLAMLLAVSCQEDRKGGGGEDNNGMRALSLFPVVEDGDDARTRANGLTFFKPGSEINVFVKDNYGTEYEKHTYAFDDTDHAHVFRSPSPYYFREDDSYITSLIAIWPTEEVREEDEFPYDQTSGEDFMLADWLIAEPTEAIMPSVMPVMLEFKRQNAKITFQLVGQNALGLDIRELTIALHVGYEGEDPGGTAFKAYCDEGSGLAQIVVRPGTRLYVEEGERIGALMVAHDDARYHYTITFSESVDLVTEEGYRYLVTLEPQGYDMRAMVSIEGFVNGGENGIGIPLQPPTEQDPDTYLIERPVQLVSLAYIIRHYTGENSIGATDNWRHKDYVITGDFELTWDMADRYLPIPRDLFQGTITREGTGEAVTEIEYTGEDGSDKILYIYEPA